MTSEFQKRLELLQLDKETLEKVLAIIDDVGKQFPCLSCPSKDDCENFKWFIKWFSE